MTKQGGKRKGAGRKPLSDGSRKVALRIFPTEKAIENCGGEEEAKTIALSAVMAVRQKNKK